MIKSRKISKSKIPFLIQRWNKLEFLMHNFYKWDHHPYFEFPLSLLVNDIDFDFSSGTIDK